MASLTLAPGTRLGPYEILSAVGDFGLAKRVEELPSPEQATRETAQLTAHGNIVGTPDYMSPEQVKAATLDERSDLFSFGVILTEMISGRHPFFDRIRSEPRFVELVKKMGIDR